MKSAADVWEKVKSLMEGSMTAVSIETWFGDVEAVALEGRRFSPLLTARLRDKQVTDRICQAFQEGRREAYRRMYERETNHVCDAGNGMN